MNSFWIIVTVVGCIAMTSLFIEMYWDKDDDGEAQEIETTFWANKCHEAFDNAQMAFNKGDEYSFRKFAEQHALYYRRYQMARDGHFERKP